MEKHFYIYIMAIKPNGTLYIGVTSDLIKRVWQHKNEETKGFTSRHKVHRLVYFKEHVLAESTITRKTIEEVAQSLEDKVDRKEDESWTDLYDEIIGI